MASTYYCWRCKKPVPMLTEEEWALVHPLLSSDTEAIKEYRHSFGVGVTAAVRAVRQRACDKYFDVTGFVETNPNSLWHHRLSVHGTECPGCGYLLRTSEASFCAHCGRKWKACDTPGS